MLQSLWELCGKGHTFLLPSSSSEDDVVSVASSTSEEYSTAACGPILVMTGLSALLNVLLDLAFCARVSGGRRVAGAVRVWTVWRGDLVASAGAEVDGSVLGASSAASFMVGMVPMVGAVLIWRIVCGLFAMVVKGL